MYIIRAVRVCVAKPSLLLAVLAVVAMLATSCSNPLVRQYEYDEQTYLGIDGSATIVISASVPALVALHNLPLDPSPSSRFSSDDGRKVFEAAGCPVTRVGRPWRRSGRRFVQVRMQVPDVRKASACGALSWSAYGFEVTPQQIRYTQTAGAATGTPPAGQNWNGSELVAFKLHLASRVTYHNVRRLEDGTEGDLERGNILTWEQRLTDRLAGAPVVMEARTETESILYRTVSLFAGAFAAAVVLLILLIWFTIRRGRARLKTFTT